VAYQGSCKIESNPFLSQRVDIGSFEEQLVNDLKGADEMDGIWTGRLLFAPKAAFSLPFRRKARFTRESHAISRAAYRRIERSQKELVHDARKQFALAME